MYQIWLNFIYVLFACRGWIENKLNCFNVKVWCGTGEKPYVGPMNLAIWDVVSFNEFKIQSMCYTTYNIFYNGNVCMQLQFSLCLKCDYVELLMVLCKVVFLLCFFVLPWFWQVVKCSLAISFSFFAIVNKFYTAIPIPVIVIVLYFNSNICAWFVFISNSIFVLY